MQLDKTIDGILAQAKKITIRKALLSKSVEEVTNGLFYCFAINVLSTSNELKDKEFFYRVMQGVAKWMTSSEMNDNLFITGDVGIGKTTVLKSIRDYMNTTELAYKKNMVSSISLADIVLHSESSWELCCTRPILLIDDVGTEPYEVKKFGNSYLPVAEVIEIRDLKKLSTIITSNLSIQEIDKRYGPRIADRINQYEKIEYKKESYRR